MKRFPASVYRLQLSRYFTLKQATELLPYLNALGIEGVYCSPYFAAHSDHGYDITDPCQLNEQVATAADYRAFCAKLKSYNMYHLLDLVPNHMGIKGNNSWFLDVLKKGKQSHYAHFFDIDWKKGEGKLLLPLLGETLKQAIQNKHLTLIKKEGEFWFSYFEDCFPTKRGSKQLEEQHYRLSCWLEAAHRINYRRFFNINELIGVRIEDSKVLEKHHHLTFQLLKKRIVNGLRIDHPDGLYDPRTYFERVRKRHKGMIVVEKILEYDEELSLDWDVDGTVGYEFLCKTTGLFINPKGEKSLTLFYQSFSGEKRSFEEILFEKKKFYALTEMAADVEGVALRLEKALGKKCGHLAYSDLLHGLYGLLAAFPVYRTYIGPKDLRVSKRDRIFLQTAFKRARQWRGQEDLSTYSLLETLFFLRLKSPALRDVILRFQQLSAPIMAKGLEDITFYHYNRLLALNEVGGNPERFGTTIKVFHQFLARKQKKWPGGLLPSSTHDTKRSEEARLQLALLSEMPEEWAETVKGLSLLAKKYKTKNLPEKNSEYLLYQTLLATWSERPSFERLWVCYEKSIREARLHTSWRHPNAAYELAAKRFLRNILSDQAFLNLFETFQRKIERLGMLNALSATILKMGAPGVADIYQGTESWRFNLVDPDNRRPVDFAHLQELFLRIGEAIELSKWLERLETGELKLYLHTLLLHFRSSYKSLILKGSYEAIPVKDPRVIAYKRVYGKEQCIIAVSRFFTQKGWKGKLTIGKGVWKDLLTGAIYQPKEGKEALSTLFTSLPFAFLYQIE